MSLIRWDPFADMSQLREQVNRLFEQSITRAGHEPTSTQTWAPAIDICETDDAIVLHAEVPGVKPEAIDIQISGDTLTIRGERKRMEQAKEAHYVRVERTYGAFLRSFTLGVPIDQQQVTAAYRDGVLEIRLPKAEEVKPKQIKIAVAPDDRTDTVNA